MTIKVSELAKKLGRTSKEVVSKAKELGIVAKAANSSLSQADAQMIENDFANSSDSTEKMGNEKNNVVNQVKRTPLGKPITKAEVESRKRPIGKPITKKEKEEKDAKVNETQMESEKELKKRDGMNKGGPLTDVDIKEKKKGDDVVKTRMNDSDSTGIRRPKIVKKAEDIRKEEERRQAQREAEKENNSSKKIKDKSDKNSRDNSRKEKDRNRGKNKDGYAGNRSGRDRKGGDGQGRPDRRERDFQRNTMDVAAPMSEGKDSKRKSKKKDKDRDRDRDDRRAMDGGRGKSRNRQDANHYGEKSLEKKIKKKHQKQKIKEVEIEETIVEVPDGAKVINVPITVAGYCEQVGVSVSNVIMTLMKLGIVTNINANLDEDTVLILSEELGITVHIGNVEEDSYEEGIEDFEDNPEDLVGRPPIITVMGHVDHGKTSLLDAIRATNVTAQESGGITQHIGASEVRLKGHKIVFLDTPGHEAFTAMRARGANITDIAILVVAADDSVKPQTIESISHAKAAGVPIIVAINKMDKPGANPDAVKKDLTEHGILVEDWGGDVISVPVSAKTGEGIENLLEMILLQAEVLELKANPKRLGLGTVIEARLDKAKGPVATLLVTNGTIKSGQSLVAGNTAGRIRLMTDYKGAAIKKAGPATAVEILGLTEVPAAGDDFHVVKDDKLAREIAEKRKQKLREEVLARNSSSTLEELFSQIKAGEVKDLNLIVKGDVRGSVGAVVSSLEKLSNDEVRVRIVHSGVGAITESDVTLASTAGAIIVGFNVRPSTGVQSMADREKVQIRTYRVIYNIIDDVENAMKGMLDPEFKEVVLGQVEIRETFRVPGVGTIGGAYVTDGKVIRNAEVRIVRDGIVIHEGKISSLKRFKDDAKEVTQGYECGIGIENYNDIKEGDVIECFQMEEVERQ